MTTKAESTTTEQTNTSDLARVSSSGTETALNADSKPTSGTPAGTAQEGTVASADLKIPNATLPAANAANASNSSSVATSGTEQVARAHTARKRLPQTASMVPMVAAFGTVTLIAAITMMVARRNNRSFFMRLRRR
jgi:hypothetical protein